jgi:hypothetical protein
MISAFANGKMSLPLFSQCFSNPSEKSRLMREPVRRLRDIERLDGMKTAFLLQNRSIERLCSLFSTP